MAATSARLVIRDSTGRDLPMVLELSLPVRHVKEKIAELHPSQPPVSTQRLVFAGRLWQDDVTLQGALGSVCVRLCFHCSRLACTNHQFADAEGWKSSC
jgi:hypothetical protein